MTTTKWQIRQGYQVSLYSNDEMINMQSSEVCFIGFEGNSKMR